MRPRRSRRSYRTRYRNLNTMKAILRVDRHEAQIIHLCGGCANEDRVEETASLFDSRSQGCLREGVHSLTAVRSQGLTADQAED